MGVPYDGTSTYRSGARFAPNAIRDASLNVESYSLRVGVDAENLPLHDLGDLDVVVDVAETLHRLKTVSSELSGMGKRLMLIGGEHTITLGAVQGIGDVDAVVSFDAHLDLRGEYMGQRVSHATVMRRIHELEGVDRVVWVGVRAVSREELEFAQTIGACYITSRDVWLKGLEHSKNALENALSNCETLYITVDIDVLDPAYAPAAQNPEPEGLTVHQLLELLCPLCGRAVAVDLVEVSPPYDNGTTAIQAAKILLEALCHMEGGRNERKCRSKP